MNKTCWTAGCTSPGKHTRYIIDVYTNSFTLPFDNALCTEHYVIYLQRAYEIGLESERQIKKQLANMEAAIDRICELASDVAYDLMDKPVPGEDVMDLPREGQEED